MNYDSFSGVDVADLEKIASEAGFRLESSYYPQFELRLSRGGRLVWSDSAWDSSEEAFDLVFKRVMAFVPGALDRMCQISALRSA